MARSGTVSNLKMSLIESQTDVSDTENGGVRRVLRSDFDISTLEAKYRYWKIAIDKEHEKTAFESQHGHYQFIAMPFGLKNLSPTFSTDHKHPSVCGKMVDNTLVIRCLSEFSEMVWVHMEHVKKVF